MISIRDTALLGEVRTVDGAATVHVADVYDTVPEDLWSAITDPERLARWIGTVEGDLRVGGQFQARFTSGWEGPGRVEVCEAPHHLVVVLEPGSADTTRVEAHLQAQDGGTRLVVEERGVPADHAHVYCAGWHTHLEHLRAMLTGAERAPWIERVTELKPLYAAARAATAAD